MLPHKDSNMRKKIDLSYANKKKSVSFKWSLINAALFILFACDLWYKCPGYTSWLHYVEGALAAFACLNAAYHALRYAALAAARGPPPAPAAPAPAPARRADEARRSASPEPDASEMMSTSRSWASSSPDEARSRSWAWRRGSPSPPASPAPAAPTPPRAAAAAGEFVADRAALAGYLRALEERAARGEAEAAAGADAARAADSPWPAPPPADRYHLAPLDTERPAGEEAEDGAAGAGGAGAWRRLRADGARLTAANRNLRLWLHLTVLERLCGAVRLLDAELAKHQARVGQVSVERLRKLAARGVGGAGAEGALAALLPFLEPFHNQQYFVQRLHELSKGGCLSEFKWNGGGSYNDAPWNDSLPTDSEIVMHLFATYMDSQLTVGQVAGAGAGAGAAGAFSARHVSRWPARPPRAPGALVLHQAAARPPHYVLVHDEEIIEPPQGRNNLLHALLLFVSAAAARGAALGRVQLGPAGLNLLWVVGR